MEGCFCEELELTCKSIKMSLCGSCLLRCSRFILNMCECGTRIEVKIKILKFHNWCGVFVVHLSDYLCLKKGSELI
jgi:hypothetical protein